MTTTETIPPVGLTRPTLQAVIESTPPAPSTQRLLSLDIFRGITIAAMMLVNNDGHGKPFAPLDHAHWNGWTPTDLIFPFFLFIVGVAIPFSLSKRALRANKLHLLGGIWFRALSIFLLGSLLQAMPYSMAALPGGYSSIRILRVVLICYTVLSIFAILYPNKRSIHWRWIVPAIGMGLVLLLIGIYFANQRAIQFGLPADFYFGNAGLNPVHYRIPGVLQRIGVCYGIAATIALFAGWRTCLIAAIIFCSTYSILMFKAPFPPVEYRGVVHDHKIGSLSEDDNLARRIDEKIFTTHNYGEYPDNEGLLSTVPAIASPLLGICIGFWLRSKRSPAERAAGLLAIGVLLTIVGCCLDSWLMPINKKIWTPSFVVFTAGFGSLGLGTIYWFADVLGYRKWALPFRIYGTNAIAAFVAAGLVVRLLLFIPTRRIDPETHRPMALISSCKYAADNLMHTLNAQVHQLLPHFPALDIPQMTSLAYAVGFVIVLLLLMTPLYLMKIYIKV